MALIVSQAETILHAVIESQTQASVCPHCERPMTADTYLVCDRSDGVHTGHSVCYDCAIDRRAYVAPDNYHCAVCVRRGCVPLGLAKVPPVKNDLANGLIGCLNDAKEEVADALEAQDDARRAEGPSRRAAAVEEVRARRDAERIRRVAEEERRLEEANAMAEERRTLQRERETMEREAMEREASVRVVHAPAPLAGEVVAPRPRRSLTAEEKQERRARAEARTAKLRSYDDEVEKNDRLTWHVESILEIAREHIRHAGGDVGAFDEAVRAASE